MLSRRLIRTVTDMDSRIGRDQGQLATHQLRRVECISRGLPGLPGTSPSHITTMLTRAIRVITAETGT